MCGRFAITKESNDLLEAIVAEHGSDAIRDWTKYWPNYNVAPTSTVPIVRQQDGVRESVKARWAMVPPGAAEFGKGKPVFNARIETVDKNGLFKKPFAEHRIIIPAAGYYEWRIADDGGKDPFFIHDPGQAMAFAAIARTWRDNTINEPDEGAENAWRLSMAIITMDAHLAPGEVHDRMPALLSPDVFEDWLGDGLDAPELKNLLIDTSRSVAETVEYYPVSRAVNKVSLGKGIPNRGPDLIEPLHD